MKSLFDAILGVLGQVIDFNSNQTFKHFLVLEMVDTCGRNNFESKDLMKVFFDFFECTAKEDRLHFLRLLLVNKRASEAKQECSLKEVVLETIRDY